MAQETTGNLRHKIAVAIMDSMNTDHEMNDNFDPDMCHRTADRIIAVLMSELTGQRFVCRYHPPHIIGPAEFYSDGVLYE